MSRSALECSTWPEYQPEAIARSLAADGRAYVENERTKVEAIRAALTVNSATNPDRAKALAEVDVVLQRFALVLDTGGSA